MWKKNLKEAIVIGFRVGTLYQVEGSPLGAMTCDTIRQTELWHRKVLTPSLQGPSRSKEGGDRDARSWK